MKYLLPFFLGLCLGSCTITYRVNLHEDRSAEVSFSLILVEDPREEKIKNSDEMFTTYDALNKTYSSKLISNFKIDSTVSPQRVSFKISEIDSLGNYISPFIKYPVSFVYTGNTLELSTTSNEGNSNLDPTGLFAQVQVDFLLQCDQEIRKLKTKSSYVSQIDKHSIRVFASLEEMEQGNGANYLKIVFKK